MRSLALVLLFVAASAALAADPPKAAAGAPALPPERMPGAPLEQVLKAFPSARETDERCLHEAVEKQRLFCTRFTARQGNLGYHLEFSKSARLIRNTEDVILADAAEGERVYRGHTDALRKALGPGKASKSSPGGT